MSSNEEQEEKKVTEDTGKEEKPVEGKQPAESAEKPAAEEPKEEAAPAAGEEKPAEEKVEEKPKGPAKQPKSTKPPKPTECAGCGKALRKKLWYYRNGSFYCTKKCYERKIEEDRKKAAEEKKKSEEA